MANPIFAIVEHANGKLSGAGREAVTAAKALAAGLSGEVHAVVLGAGVGPAAEAAAALGVAKVLSLDHAGLHPYATAPWLGALSRLVTERQPQAVVLAHGPVGRDLASRLAARVGASLATDCTKVEVVGGAVQAERPVYAGKLVSTVELAGPVRVLSVRAKSYDRAEAGGAKAPVEAVAVTTDAADLRAVVRELVEKGAGKVPLTEADVVVSGGRGIKGPEHFKILEELADVLGGAVGASRAVVDAGWREHSAQVGQTGKVVRPKLYIACGISGAIQHLVGMQNSKYILAINKDPEAPIFKKADFGIVGDLFEIVPELTKAFKAALGK